MRIQKCTKGGGKFTDTLYYDAESLGGILGCGGSNTLLKTSDRVFVGGGGNYLTEIVNSSGQPAKHTLPQLGSVTKIFGTTGAVIVQGKDTVGNGVILHYMISTGAVTTVLEAGVYVISAMDVASNGDITFHGLRASDGAKILANIPAGTSTVNIVSQSLPTVTRIQRIN